MVSFLDKDLTFKTCSIKHVLKNTEKASNSLFFISLLPVSDRGDHVFKNEQRVTGWPCSSGFLKDLLDNGKNILRMVVVCLQGLWHQVEPRVWTQPKNIFFVYKRLLNCLVTLQNYVVFFFFHLTQWDNCERGLIVLKLIVLQGYCWYQHRKM